MLEPESWCIWPAMRLIVLGPLGRSERSGGDGFPDSSSDVVMERRSGLELVNQNMRVDEANKGGKPTRGPRIGVVVKRTKKGGP